MVGTKSGCCVGRPFGCIQFLLSCFSLRPLLLLSDQFGARLCPAEPSPAHSVVPCVGILMKKITKCWQLLLVWHAWKPRYQLVLQMNPLFCQLNFLYFPFDCLSNVLIIFWLLWNECCLRKGMLQAREQTELPEDNFHLLDCPTTASTSFNRKTRKQKISSPPPCFSKQPGSKGRCCIPSD